MGSAEGTHQQFSGQRQPRQPKVCDSCPWQALEILVCIYKAPSKGRVPTSAGQWHPKARLLWQESILLQQLLASSFSSKGFHKSGSKYIRPSFTSPLHVNTIV